MQQRSKQKQLSYYQLPFESNNNIINRTMQQQSAKTDLLNEESQLDGSYDWREEENQKTQFKQPRIKDLFPANYTSERQRFFQNNANYNPHFCYNVIVFPQVIPLSTQYEELALKILSNNKYQTSSLPLLNQTEVLKMIGDYLEGLGLGEYVQVKLEGNCLSRTSIGFFKEKAVLKLRTPLEYDVVSLEGVLNHEVGTHILRRLNHKDNCIRRPSEKGKLIEQGLAAINQLLPQEKPFLFKAALRYIAAIAASKLPFCQLYKQIARWLSDPKDCWRECVRVKRGMANTEAPGGYYKDQSYLIGAIEILRERKNIDFRKIYYGKLAPNQTVNLHSGVLPPFIDTEEKYKYYLKKLDTMALCNFID